MSNTIQIKRSSTASSVPTAGQLAQGELAVNLVDKKLYTKDNTNAVVEITPTNATNLTGTATSNIQTSALASGTANNTTFLRGDRTWQTISTSPTTQQVLNATAGASVGDVGTYAFCLRSPAVSSLGPGDTVSGSNLRYTNANGAAVTTVGVGTWRIMGEIVGTGFSQNSSVFLRIS
jgi:hypothetical protein